MSRESRQTPYGSLPSFLSEGRLGDLCVSEGVQTGPFGSQLHQEDYVAIGTPIITVEHLGDNRIVHRDLPCVSDADRKRLAKYSLRTGDIVFSRVGSVDRRAIVQEAEDGWLFSGRCLRVRPDHEKLDPKWLSYFFGMSAFKQYIRGIAVGATMPSINTKILSDVPIYYPEIDVQRAAGKFLTLIDDKINLNRRINQTLEAMGQAIFKSWFVDFEPVKAKIAAKAEGRDPLRAAMSAISGKSDAELDALPREQFSQLAATSALFPDEVEDSVLGEIPKGWGISKVETLITRISAKTRYTKNEVYDYGKTPVFEQGASIILGYHDAAATYQASAGEPAFIFGDHTCVIRLSCQPFDISQNVIPLRGRGRATTWVYYAVKEKQKFQEYRRHWMELISKDVVVASVDVALDFSKKVSIFHLKIEENERQMLGLRELRDILLPKLLSGELSVADTKMEIEA